MNIVIEAIRTARECHKGQIRKYTNEPFIVHPSRVAARVSMLPEVDEHILAASWCHDVLEDAPTFGTHRLIQRIGEQAAIHVVALTNPSIGLKRPRAVRKKMDRDWLSDQSDVVKQVKLCDVADNLLDFVNVYRSSLAPKMVQFLAMYAEEKELLLEALGSVHGELEKEIRGYIKILKDLKKEKKS